MEIKKSNKSKYSGYDYCTIKTDSMYVIGSYNKTVIGYLIFELFNTSIHNVGDLRLGCYNVGRHTAGAVHHEDEIGVRVLFDHPFKEFLSMNKFRPEKMSLRVIKKLI